jgi:hypothetical protein
LAEVGMNVLERPRQSPTEGGGIENPGPVAQPGLLQLPPKKNEPHWHWPNPPEPPPQEELVYKIRSSYIIMRNPSSMERKVKEAIPVCVHLIWEMKSHV